MPAPLAEPNLNAQALSKALNCARSWRHKSVLFQGVGKLLEQRLKAGWGGLGHAATPLLGMRDINTNDKPGKLARAWVSVLAMMEIVRIRRSSAKRRARGRWIGKVKILGKAGVGTSSHEGSLLSGQIVSATGNANLQLVAAGRVGVTGQKGTQRPCGALARTAITAGTTNQVG